MGLLDIIIDIPASIYDYVFTDQEKEGREAGTIAAAEAYKPILNKQKRFQAEINEIISNEKLNFDKQVEIILNKCYSYTITNENFSFTINEKRGKSSDLDGVLDIIQGNDYSRWGENFYMFFSLNPLRRSMYEKRLRFFFIEFDNKRAIWQDKIKETNKGINDSIDELFLLKTTNQEALRKIKEIILHSTDECFETSTQLAVCKFMGNIL